MVAFSDSTRSTMRLLVSTVSAGSSGRSVAPVATGVQARVLGRLKNGIFPRKRFGHFGGLAGVPSSPPEEGDGDGGQGGRAQSQLGQEAPAGFVCRCRSCRLFWHFLLLRVRLAHRVVLTTDFTPWTGFCNSGIGIQQSRSKRQPAESRRLMAECYAWPASSKTMAATRRPMRTE